MLPSFQQDLHCSIQPFCVQGHPLIWHKHMHSTCAMCLKSSLMSRWKCPTCAESYCVQCMRPPVAGDECPLGHPLQKMVLPCNSCDICRSSINGQKGYRDATCDFDLCLNCHKDFIKED